MKKKRLQLLTELCEWMCRPDTSGKVVPGACGSHWKCSIAKCWSASGRHDKCRRTGRSQAAAASIHFSGHVFARLSTLPVRGAAKKPVKLFLTVQNFIASAKESMFNLAFVCLSVYLTVNTITQKVADELPWIFLEGCGVRPPRSD